MESIGRLDARMLRGGAQTNLEVLQDHSKHFVCKQDSVNKSKSKSPRPEESGTSLWLNEPPDFGESGQPRLAARREHVTSRLEAPKKSPKQQTAIPDDWTIGRLPVPTRPPCIGQQLLVWPNRGGWLWPNYLLPIWRLPSISR